jgi:Zn finger protein HypA/HybF involved in hydrogenase expression
VKDHGLLLRTEADLRCQECPAIWQPEETMRWRAYLTEERPPSLILYCPACSSREFGDGISHAA